MGILGIAVDKQHPIGLNAMAQSFAESIIAIFKRDKRGIRPVFGENFPFTNDPNWDDYFLFYEYFHGDTGKGLGASHQTGWTGLVANFIQEYR